MTTEERKQQLVLDCAADRAAWVRACYPPQQGPMAALAAKVLGWSGALGVVVPGRFGRLLRGASFLGQLARNFVRLRA